MNYSQKQFRFLTNLKKEIVDSCGRCAGEGWTRENDELVECLCIKVFRFVKEMYIANLPKKYWPFYLPTLWISDEYKSMILHYLRNIENAVEKGLGFMFLGKPGIGKTVAMVEIAKGLITKGYKVHYTIAERLINKIFTDKESGNFSFYSQFNVLFLDELDKLRVEGVESIRLTMENVFRFLLGEGKVMIIAANWTTSEVERCFGQSFYSLLKRYLNIFEFSEESQDFSERTEGDWLSELESKLDYFCEGIVFYAKRMKSRSI